MPWRTPKKILDSKISNTFFATERQNVGDKTSRPRRHGRDRPFFLESKFHIEILNFQAI